MVICVITSDFKYKWFGTFQRKTMKKNVLVRSRTFWIVLVRSFEICVFVYKQGDFRWFLIVRNVLESTISFVFKIACDDTYMLIFTRKVLERTISFVFKIACDNTYMLMFRKWNIYKWSSIKILNWRQCKWGLKFSTRSSNLLRAGKF